ncbi:MAG: hypothetical protein LBP59_18015 [Planctomycetaceae bacterium]|nr:hypothetical protein [Planctomycetaceae bacterium]
MNFKTIRIFIFLTYGGYGFSVFMRYLVIFFTVIQIVLEFLRFKIVKACRPITRQAAVNAN